MNRIPLYLGILSLAVGLVLFQQSTKPPFDFAKKAADKLVEMENPVATTTRGEARLAAAGFIDQSLAWKRQRRNPALGLLALGLGLVGVFFYLRRAESGPLSAGARVVAAACLAALAAGAVLLVRGLDVPADFAVQMARQLNDVEEAQRGYDPTRAVDIQNAARRESEERQEAQQRSGYLGLGLVGASVVAFALTLRGRKAAVAPAPGLGS